MLIGTFKLELGWQPVSQLMGKNLEWAKLLAEQKNIRVIIIDTTSASANAVSPYLGEQMVELGWILYGISTIQI